MHRLVEEKIRLQSTSTMWINLFLCCFAVTGHAGAFVFGSLGGKEVCVMNGRFHAYEGHSAGAVRTNFFLLISVIYDMLKAKFNLLPTSFYFIITFCAASSEKIRF